MEDRRARSGLLDERGTGYTPRTSRNVTADTDSWWSRHNTCWSDTSARAGATLPGRSPSARSGGVPKTTVFGTARRVGRVESDIPHLPQASLLRGIPATPQGHLLIERRSSLSAPRAVERRGRFRVWNLVSPGGREQRRKAQCFGWSECRTLLSAYIWDGASAHAVTKRHVLSFLARRDG